MGTKLRSLLRKYKWLLLTTAFIIVLYLSFARAVAAFGWDWTGFTGATGPILQQNEQYRPAKTLWDWLQLLIIPIVLAAAGFWLNQIQKSREERTTQQKAALEREIAHDNQREAALQAYINNMSQLLLEKKLRESKPEDEVRKIARLVTLTVLPGLDHRRKGSVLQLLYEAGLIERDEPIVNLRGANFEGAYLFRAGLSRTNLSRAHLERAHLWNADLSYASLVGTRLQEADLEGADLEGADLSEADLSGATVTTEQLEKAKLLQGAIMPAGKIHP